MAVLIQGEKMPKNCGCCPCSNYTCMAIDDGVEVVEYFEGDKRRPDCPLIEVPEPHGRLGDLDELEKRIKYVANLEWNQKVGASGGMLAALELVSDTQAIITATAEGET